MASIGKVYREVNPPQKKRPCMRCKKVKVEGRSYCSQCRIAIRKNRYEY